MLQLSKERWKEVITDCDNLPENIKFSSATPFAFTERRGYASSVLNSDKAIHKVSNYLLQKFNNGTESELGLSENFNGNGYAAR